VTGCVRREGRGKGCKGAIVFIFKENISIDYKLHPQKSDLGVMWILKISL
jgi:hypothetical protein